MWDGENVGIETVFFGVNARFNTVSTGSGFSKSIPLNHPQIGPLIEKQTPLPKIFCGLSLSASVDL